MTIPLQNTLSIITNKLKNWWELFINNLPNIAVAAFVLLISFFLSRFIYKATSKLLYKKVKQNAVTKLIARTTAFLVVLAGLILALSALNLGKSITGL